jgi:glycosyltransferase involved in cell wall biosynthesis
MNIWYIHPYGGGPGIGRFFRPFHLANEWKKLGHSTTVFVADYHHLLDIKQTLPTRQSVEGVDYVALSTGHYQGNGISRIMNMAQFCASLWATRKRVGKDLEKPDAIIVSSPHPFAIYPARALAKRFGAKLVFEVRDLWPLSITEINGSSKWHPFVLLTAITERYAYKKSDLVASLLPGVENYMRERNMAYKNFVWVPNGVEPDATEPKQPTSDAGLSALEILSKWQKQKRTVVVYAGALGKPNAIDLLIDAVKIISSKNDNHKVSALIVGDGDRATELRQQAKHLPVDIMQFTGRLPKNEALWLMKASDIAYGGLRPFDNVFKYGISPNKLLDFILMGLPVVLPTRAYQDPVTVTKGGIAVPTGKSSDIAIAIESLAALPKAERQLRAKTAKENLHRIFNYTAIAKNYIDSISSSQD